MKKVFFIFVFMFALLNSYGQEREFGFITITPYIAPETGVSGNTAKLLYAKLNQIVSVGEVCGGFDKRFIITPTLDIISESTTASIPQKSSLKINFTFFIGDGVSGSLFGNSNVEITGIGNSREEAIYAAIRKINTRNKGIQTLITDSKLRIVKYYNMIAPTLVKEAEGDISSNNYETALSKLSVIPTLCMEYDRAQQLIVKCGSKILERDNAQLLTQAKAAWSTNPNKDGAKEANEYISQITISSKSICNEVNQLIDKMQKRLIELDDKEIEFQYAKILSDERLKTEQINASERATSSFFSIMPDLIYNIFRWF